MSGEDSQEPSSETPGTPGTDIADWQSSPEHEVEPLSFPFDVQIDFQTRFFARYYRFVHFFEMF